MLNYVCLCVGDDVSVSVCVRVCVRVCVCVGGGPASVCASRGVGSSGAFTWWLTFLCFHVSYPNMGS